ncbi:MAG: hypothetical protein IJX18_03185 [Clostridia bacterium]|nr:hypothetical protein [Clostridia bacterium]
MELRVKTALYAYPKLDRIVSDYEEHVKNKAYLSYGSRMTTEKLAEYLALEIVRKQSADKLKKGIEETLRSLDEEEKMLLEARYFGKIDKVRRLFAAQKAGLCRLPFKPWCERTYYRKQAKLLKKITGILKGTGVLTEKRFDEEYMEIDHVAMLYQYLLAGKEVNGSKKERQLLCFLSKIK